MRAAADVRPRLRTATGEVAIDPARGNLVGLRFETGGRTLRPLHVAHWVDDEAALAAMLRAQSDLAPVERHLGGDFFCAPFGASDVEPAPIHGWPANAAWHTVSHEANTVRMTLPRRVLGAGIEKCVSLADEAPLLYQEHLIQGGSGGLPVAHHPMVRLAGGARLCLSAKRAALVPDRFEPGRTRLAGPVVLELDPASSPGGPLLLPGADGCEVDLARLPIGDAHEDFVGLVEAHASTLGWSAVVRDVEDDIVFFLKDPRVLPATMLWHSNGGRDRLPWGGRHTGVLGIEDACAAGTAGHAAALADNPYARLGVPTALELAPGRTHRVRHVIGAIARPPGWQAISAIEVLGDELRLQEASGEERRMAFRASWFARE